MDLKQYAIVLVNLDPTIGSEIKKTRPCVIISPNEMNTYLNTIVLAPMTTNLKKYPTRVAVNHHGKKGMIAIDQIQTVDKSRIIRVFEKLTETEIAKCKEVIKEAFND
ncbi:MAG: type II toxin-antitoxin system PemK/MazF family toxin [Flavobacteriia bacterium]|nr:type II toxin-antitoxin system PemK/MazF family toxin [Flavobacteriia bacterium]OIP47175.1 MAG: growth inhibitor PemK [Flavobacteriaceae bacterium CG2_30_31_66]PIV97672.1 MAG: growth inhibitor PemK [Flavobacteriaceae bacterium CG17_big_fil_post_rev_8_21_14_2_50_31_13]PIX12253.1 MAG: growth inhibitor PemK [Flavobacteriaceae bacterium CG_4_8_14_3_um_filter_31_8]PIY13821.1 MAG: growth inhibitor PemK [Flavobacteriaceae bacterium CG_4_10_14_3_um_filter_31_253]